MNLATTLVFRGINLVLLAVAIVRGVQMFRSHAKKSGVSALLLLLGYDAFRTGDAATRRITIAPELTVGFTAVLLAVLYLQFRPIVRRTRGNHMTSQPTQPTPQVPENGVTGNPDAEPATIYDPDSELAPGDDTGEDGHGTEDMTAEDQALAASNPPPPPAPGQGSN